MSKKELFKRLNELCNEMDNSYYINSGGCCFVAACIAQNFENVNIPYEVIIYNEYRLHYAIRISDRYINRSDYKHNEISEVSDYNSEDLYDIYYNKEEWNHCYNKKWNLIVSTRIRALFNKYLNK